MRQTASGFGLAEKTRAILLFLFGRLALQRNSFYRDQTVDPGVPALVDDAHGSATKFGQNFVPSETSFFAVVHGSIDRSELGLKGEGTASASAETGVEESEYCGPGNEIAPSYYRFWSDGRGRLISYTQLPEPRHMQKISEQNAASRNGVEELERA
jgi:hypothetical protein